MKKFIITEEQIRDVKNKAIELAMSGRLVSAGRLTDAGVRDLNCIDDVLDTLVEMPETEGEE